jgi:hypothetical protein
VLLAVLWVYVFEAETRADTESQAEDTKAEG